MCSFHAKFYLLQAVTVAARGRVGRNFQQLADLFKRVAMPDLQDNDFALLDWQLGETAHGRAFALVFRRRFFKPVLRFEFACQAPPERSPVVERAIPKAAHTVMLRPMRLLRLVQQSDERFLQNVLGLGVTEPKRAAIKNQLGGFCLIQRCLPTRWFVIIHGFIS